MKRNVGTTDRALRIILGLVVAGVGLYYESFWGFLAAPLLITGMLGRCQLYSLLGIRTTNEPEREM